MKKKTLFILTLLFTVGLDYTSVQAQNTDKQRNVYNEHYKQIECLAKNIYFEARDQSDLGQKAIAWVTLNRVHSKGYPSTICDVVWQDSQFSWTHDGKSDTPKNQEDWIRAKKLASLVYTRYYNPRTYKDPTDGAIMFHATYAKPYWRKSYERTIRIGDHIFYKDS
jgi:spore germination cell wall hydrolase CwlJ-like protein